MSVSHGMILAAGLGTRMRPLTLEKPKPLIPVAGKPLIDWNLEWLSAGGIRHAVINTSYLADQLEAHVHGRATLSREGAPPLETGGGVKKALPLLGNDVFLTMNSDAILPLESSHPLRALEEAWGDDVDFLLLVVHRRHAIGWEGNGDFVLEHGRIRRPRAGEVADYIFTGVELMHPRAFDAAPDGAFSLSTLWARHAEPEGWFNRVRAIAHEGAWLNVGDLEGLRIAEAYFRARA